jgi:predicted SnoaL-like aldol condensation-catalyzing enzyme
MSLLSGYITELDPSDIPPPFSSATVFMRFHSLAVLGVLIPTAITKRIKCTSDFQGTQMELQAAQQDAFANFAGLFLVQRDIQQAFDLYIPGCVVLLSLVSTSSISHPSYTLPFSITFTSEYINHNPFANSGRENALAFLLPALAEPTLTISNIEWFSGQGYGVLHYKMGLNGTYSAVMDKFRFEGTCIVEHWDTVQGITGNESNPIAYF